MNIDWGIFKLPGKQQIPKKVKSRFGLLAPSIPAIGNDSNMSNCSSASEEVDKHCMIESDMESSPLEDLNAVFTEGDLFVVQETGMTLFSEDTEHDEEGKENEGDPALETTVPLCQNKSGAEVETADSIDGDAKAVCAPEDDECNSVLDTFVDVLVSVVCGDSMSNHDVKHAFSSFIRARVADGHTRDEAKSEAVSVLRCATKAKKAGL